MRRPTIEERAEDLARFLTKRTKSRFWCRCINPETVDIRYRETDPIAQLASGYYERGYREIGLDPASDLALRLGLFPYASTNTPAWEREALRLNAAIRRMVETRQSQYRKRRPPTTKRSMHNSKRVKRKR
jgi:hypothetical protein